MLSTPCTAKDMKTHLRKAGLFRQGDKMNRVLRAAGAAMVVLLTLSVSQPSVAQKRGGILRMYTLDSPASMSPHEEATVFSQGPTAGVFNNLLIFDQHAKQSRLETVQPELATGWSWNEDSTVLTLPLRQGVKWH